MGTARPAAACGARSPPPRRGAVRPRRRCVGSGVAHAPRHAASPALCAPCSGFRSPMPTLVCRRDGGGPTPPTSNARTPPGVCPAARLSSDAAPQRRRQRPRAEGSGPGNSGEAEAAGGAWGSRAAAATPPAPHALASRNLSAPSPIGLRWRPRHTGVTDEVSLQRGLDQRMGGEFGVPPLRSRGVRLPTLLVSGGFPGAGLRLCTCPLVKGSPVTPWDGLSFRQAPRGTPQIPPECSSIRGEIHTHRRSLAGLWLVCFGLP